MARKHIRKETFVDRTGRRVAGALDLPADALSQMPRLYMVGNRELVIEGHTGIVSYEEQEIKVGGGTLLICVLGKRLCMNSFSQDSLGIKGVITEIRFVI